MDGGESRNQQSLLQVTNFATIVIAPVTLVETATETSRDIGSMFGLKAKVDLNRWVAVAAGGEIGFADRAPSAFRQQQQQIDTRVLHHQPQRHAAARQC